MTEQSALERIKNAGYRITRPREAIVRLLMESSVPLSAYDIQKLLQDAENLSPITVYRVLDLLVELNIAHKIQSGSFIRCQNGGQTGCHHFMICEACHAVEEFRSSDSCDITAIMAKAAGFVPAAHSVEITGTCRHCK